MLDGKRRWDAFVTNSIVEFAMNDPQISEAFQLHLARLETALSGAIERAKQAGELSRDVDAAEAAAFLVCTTQGLNVLAKTCPAGARWRRSRGMRSRRLIQDLNQPPAQAAVGVLSRVV